jgi:hypothetical protein
VLDLSTIEGYEALTFNLGDKTWVEDVEFFGYNDNGAPYREEVVITGTTIFLDEPEKDSYTMQNRKN